MNFILILIGKIFSVIIQKMDLGNGSTWPGHIALTFNPNFLKELITNNPKLITILIAGTNGKTTTGKLIRTILEKTEKKVFQNNSGANLLNGIASTLISNSDYSGKIKKDFAVFEIDENTLPLILREIPNPNYIILLNLFRDQLDRYGEVNTIASKWKDAIRRLSSDATLILNADDPLIAYLGKSHPNVVYFGIDSKNASNKIQHASDSTYCPECGKKLNYKSIYFSHLGIWECKECGFKHPEKLISKFNCYPLKGIYNDYNTNAAVAFAKKQGFTDKQITSALNNFKPAFGRQEILNIKGKKIQIFLSKNPTGLNESLRTIKQLGAQNLMLLLNDRIPDGRDVSWIWDVDFEDYSNKFINIMVSGDRVYDMALRLKYAEFKSFETEENLEIATKIAIDKTAKNETLYILATYSAMLDVRKILTGRKIL